MSCKLTCLQVPKQSTLLHSHSKGAHVTVGMLWKHQSPWDCKAVLSAGDIEQSLAVKQIEEHHLKKGQIVVLASLNDYALSFSSYQRQPFVAPSKRLQQLGSLSHSVAGSTAFQTVNCTYDPTADLLRHSYSPFHSPQVSHPGLRQDFDAYP